MKTALLTAALLAAATSAWAQPTIGGGAQLQQIPPAPVQPRSIPDLRIERGGPLDDGQIKSLVRYLLANLPTEPVAK